MSEMVHVGVSNNEYSQLNTTIQSELSACGFNEYPVSTDVMINVGCGYKTYGRYVYISLIRGNNGDGEIALSEVEVYMGEYLNKLYEIYVVTSLTNLKANYFEIESVEMITGIFVSLYMTVHKICCFFVRSI